MRRIKVFNTVFILVFIVTIVTPIFLINTEPNKVSTLENRVLAQFPNMKSEGKINKNFISQFETWFNDNIGLRDKITNINNMMLYKLFGKINRENTFKGKDDWIYFMYPNMVTEYQNMISLEQTELQKYLIKYKKIDNYLKGKEIPFLVSIAPTKENIYPEYMMNTILRKGTNSKADDIVKYMQTNSDLDFFSLKPALLDAKKYGIVYSKNCDVTHWNRRGALVGYFELMNRMKKYIPDLKVLKWEDFNTEDYQRQGEIVNGIPVKEIDTKYTLKSGYTSKLDNRIFKHITVGDSSNLSYRYINENSQLPKLLIMGDSFIYQFILPEISESFSEVVFLHLNNLMDIKKYVEIFNPDMVLLEAMEPAITSIKDNVYYSDDYFDSYSDYINLPTRNTVVPTNWVDYINAEIVNNQEEWNIDETTPITKIEGWAIDPVAQNVASKIYLQVGDEYYEAEKHQKRQSVVEVLGNKNYLYSGFTFEIKTSDLLANSENVKLITVSRDKSAKYIGKNITVKTGHY